MSIDRETVKKIAYLARIRVEDSQLDPLAGEISGIMDWIEQLSELDTNGVEPMASVAAMTLPMRKDAVTDGNCRDSVLKNAPDGEDGFFAVPKVVE
ncbi:MAG: Asp-tRNA(Asn)/Glu-tRNA(Gln) amidotransferase subunit GatC [Rhodospirillaceae bacterium]|nr:Asp-tRNA(Asn)/Glu-tRNA(Gln) amidotransferase subunit GatC [Rhodospirillaceae bacterium]MDH5771771.1 Asp-tRNA(Asn)/Glu-tRNA(Gln) amidotransferase subunit GatC [Rhodospirillaceae bacterium]